MSLFGKVNRHRDNYRVSYVVTPNDESLPRKNFKYKRKAFNYALSCGPGTFITKNEDYTNGSSFGGVHWYVDWVYPFKKDSNIKIYKYGNIKKRLKLVLTKSDKLYRGFSYKVYTKMIHIGNELEVKTMDELLPVVNNLLKLFEKQGIDFENPEEDMVKSWEIYRDNGTNTLEECPWHHWSDRCNTGRAYTIFMCYMGRDLTNVFEKLEDDFVNID